MNQTKSWIASRPAVIGLAFLLGVVGLGVAHEKMSTNNPPASLKLAAASEGPSRNSYAPVLKSVLPAVVNISSSKVVRGRTESSEEMMPFFRQFFGGEDGGGNFALPQPQDHREKSLGSGVIVSPEGYASPTITLSTARRMYASRFLTSASFRATLLARTPRQT